MTLIGYLFKKKNQIHHLDSSNDTAFAGLRGKPQHQSHYLPLSPDQAFCEQP